ncbi:hypothetical protein FN976_19585 [Caenimonas sedimenti]|uniref:Uncharacterized protein n=1 Tax=Caenimonas sedimenti TaxID=2596921 RepID=A0A562ZLN1_9BURK|nr:hypothetical protein [Caenimonas sedimenti]TWO69489.1 hypothetical protein FN976_19585 [Caenimonas sedimenti]
MPPHRQDDREHGPESTGSFVHRLLRRVRAKGPPPEEPQPAKREVLPPSGQRSGTGAASAEPFLKEERDSRPTPLE